jgi:hypothetical protein
MFLLSRHICGTLLGEPVRYTGDRGALGNCCLCSLARGCSWRRPLPILGASKNACATKGEPLDSVGGQFVA